MKKKLSILMLALLLLMLTACGSSGGGNSGAASSSQMDDSKEGGYSYDSYSYEEPSMNEAGENQLDVPSTSASSFPANTKIILSADLVLETKEFETAEQALTRIVENAGGWFESRSVYGGTYRSLRCTIRVPSEEFHSFLEQTGQTAHITRREEYAEDVSEAYYDQESRLATQRTKLERFQLLLSQAEDMESIIALTNAISETELEIEHLTGSLRKYDSLVGYSTITLRLEEVYRLSSEEEPAITFGQRMGQAFSVGLSRGISGVEDFMLGVARNWMNLLILIAVIAAAVCLLRLWKKKRAKKEILPPPSPSDSDSDTKDK